MICPNPNCKKSTDSVKSVVKNRTIHTGCSACLHTLVKGHELAASYHRKTDYRDHAADLVQPFEDDFAKVYGADKAREFGWGEEAIRKYT
jgi:hypothetical protein